jgi:hypothetical protein
MSQRYQGGILGVGFNPLQAPNAPTIGTATAGNQNVSVAFTAPANVGGSAISSYRVLANPGGIGATGSSSPVTVSGLINGTTYTFSLAAVNSYGFSPYSGTVSGTPVAPSYVENVFSTWLYTGTGSAITITNGIDLAGKGGMVWVKDRTSAYQARIVDTVRGATNGLIPSATNATVVDDSITALNSNGFTVGNTLNSNGSGDNYASWTFREAPKFFDVVTWTGNGATLQTINHNLGVAPGMLVIKCTSATGSWYVYHRSTGQDSWLSLNATDAVSTNANGNWNVTSTTFDARNWYNANVPGATYVAYLYAHDAGGFGDLGTDSIISCGSYTTDGGGNGSVTLGWEPQWILAKNASTTGSWVMFDNMRGMPVAPADARFMLANTNQAESAWGVCAPNATGFTLNSMAGASQTVIYIAIRRGPMQVPTVGTSVFNPTAGTGTTTTVVNTGFPVDLLMPRSIAASNSTFVLDRLRGISSTSSTNATWLRTDSTDAENTSASFPTFFNNTGFTRGSNFGTANTAFWSFSRAPGFFDEVCYTGTGAQISVPHNLGVVPEIIITKRRDSTGAWLVYTATTGLNNYLVLNATDAVASASNYSAVSATAFNAPFNNSGATFVSYLFASAPGVSKVGSYTGTGTTQTINCGFTTGARFVLIKRTDSTGDWFVWDSARGIVAGNDPYLLLNSTAAEVTGTDYVDTDNSGFQLSSTAPAALNANGGTYIFLAIS